MQDARIYALLQRVGRQLHTATNRIQPFELCISCVGVLLAYLTGIYVTGSFHETSRWMGAMLSCTSVVVVLHTPGFKESLRAGRMRVLGTLLGALIAYGYLRVCHFTILGMLASVAVLELLCMLLNIYNNGRIATITLLIILLVSQMTPHIDPAINCLLRFFESAVGVSIGVGLVWATEYWNQWIARQRKSQPKPGQHVNIDTMPLRGAHFRLFAATALGQVAGGVVATLVGIILPMIQLIRHPALNSLQQGLVACTNLVGIMVGSVLVGAWSDRKGYLFFIRLCPFVMLAASLTAFIIDNLYGLVAGLFLLGCGIGGEYSLDSDYISEIMPRRWRLFMVGMAKATSSVGNIAAAVIGYFLLRIGDNPHTWNRLLLVVAGLSLVMILCRIRFYQSPGWLLAHGETEKAAEAVRRFLGKDVELGELLRRPKKEPAATTVPKGRFLWNGNGRKIIFSGIPWACEGFGVYGIGVFLPLLIMTLGLEPSSKEPLTQIIGSVKTTAFINCFVLLGFGVGLLRVKGWNHVRSQVRGFGFSAIGLVILLIAYRFHLPVWVSIGGFLFFEFFLNAGPHLMTFIIPPQIYPVRDRGAGVGLAAAIGKIGGIVGVLLAPMLLRWGGVELFLGSTIAVLLVGAWITAHYGQSILPGGKRRDIRHDR